MKILFESLHIFNDRANGISLYVYNLITNYNRLHPEDKLYILCWDKMEKIMQQQFASCQLTIIPVSIDMIWDDITKEKGFHRKSLYRLMKDYDVVISSVANNSRYGLHPLVRHIGVVHDLQLQHLFYDNLPWKQKLIKRILTIKKFHLFSDIISISEFVKKDIRRYTGVKAKVIYNSWGNISDKEQCPQDVDANMQYILDVNAIVAYKNAEVLIEAFKEIKDDFPELKLYLKGEDFNYAHVLKALIKQYGMEDKVIIDTSNRSAEEMTWLYRHAQLFVTPSTMEGFGYTPVEAVVAHTPVISSNIDTLREVLGDNAIYFDPHSVRQLVNQIKQVLTNRPSFEQLKQRANDIKEKYSVERQIAQFHKLIHKT